MQKITFENSPSTNTPINATNLNAIQTNVENAINESKIKYADIYFSLIPSTPNAKDIGTGTATINLSSLNATELIDVSFNYASGNAVFVLKSNLSDPTSIEVYGYTRNDIRNFNN